MAIIRVTKSFTFEMAHALWNYNGPCKNIQGHSYKLFVTVKGQASENIESTKLGMVMDFSDLKKIVKTQIVDVFDHSVIISNRASKPDIQRVEQMFEKFYIVDYQPTCENLVTDMIRMEDTAKGVFNNVTVGSMEVVDLADATIDSCRITSIDFQSPNVQITNSVVDAMAPTPDPLPSPLINSTDFLLDWIYIVIYFL